jgi:hypothetical protein
LTALSSEKIARYAKVGVPVITMKNESYQKVFESCKFGEMVERIDEIPEKIKMIEANYDLYRENACRAFEMYYDYDKNMVGVLREIKAVVARHG